MADTGILLSHGDTSILVVHVVQLVRRWHVRRDHHPCKPVLGLLDSVATGKEGISPALNTCDLSLVWPATTPSILGLLVRWTGPHEMCW